MQWETQISIINNYLKTHRRIFSFSTSWPLGNVKISVWAILVRHSAASSFLKYTKLQINCEWKGLEKKKKINAKRKEWNTN